MHYCCVWSAKKKNCIRVLSNYILGVPVGQTSTEVSMFDRPSGFAGFRWRSIPFGTAALPLQSLTLIIDAHYQVICA